jgi:predicted metal-dependent hydrolase
LKAPRALSIEQATRFVESKRSLVYKKLAEKDALAGPKVVKQFVDGEGFKYLGRNYRLLIDERMSEARLERGRLLVPPRANIDGLGLVRDWYVRCGVRWTRQRVRPWAARAGFDGVQVQLQNLGFRWGSARPSDDPPRINIHWSTLQLPPSLIDYVLVHELAHLREPNHTPEFWALVARWMPGFEAEKARLAVAGRHVWLGESDCSHQRGSSHNDG